MTIVKTLLNNAVKKIKFVSDTPLKEVESIFCFVNDTDKVALATKDIRVTKEQEKRFKSLVEERATGKPLAYILGRKGFYGREFIVSSYTLIPRPETELIIDEVKKIAKTMQALSIIDIGTGSGNIAITLALEIPEAKITATDDDDKALQVAKKNAQTHGVTIEFVESDLLESVHSAYDIIVANLPYVPDVDRTKLRDKYTLGLQFEPQHALYAGRNGLDLYKKLFAQITTLPKYILLEIDPRQTDEIKRLILSLSPHTIKVVKDLVGLDRVVISSF